MVALFKTISPKKIKKSIFLKEMKAGLVETGVYILKQFNKTTRTFSKPVKFITRTRVSSQPMRVRVYTNNKIYAMLDKGTKKHVITPTKPHGLLVFPAVTRPKTTPRLISSKKGFKSKKMIFIRGPVTVRGIEARKFRVEIKKKAKPVFMKNMQRRLNIAARKSGHKIRKI